MFRTVPRWLWALPVSFMACSSYSLAQSCAAQPHPHFRIEVGADRPVSSHDFIDARKVQSLRQRISADAHGFHEFGLENLSQVNRKDSSRFRHRCPAEEILSQLSDADDPLVCCA
jgi:hypothetical protein